MNVRPLLRVGFLCAFALSTACWVSGADNPEQSAQSSAEQWLALIDAGHYGESWQRAGSHFQGAVTQAQWKTTLETVRKPLGTVTSRKLKSARRSKALAGAPPGDYVTLQFQTSFANKDQAIETVTPGRDADGNWKVARYFIN